MENALERSNFARSVFVPSIRNFDSSKQRRRNIRAHHEAVTAQVYHERNRVNVDARPVDWRMVLEVMARSTSKCSLEYIEDGIKINVDKSVLGRVLTSAGDDALGVIRRRTGATIKVSRDESTLLLSGTRQAINRATEVFRSMAGTISVTRQFRPRDPRESDIEEMGNEEEFFTPPLSRDEGAYVKKRRHTQHAYLTPMPLEWTAKTLKDYVVSLVDTYIDPALHAPTYQSTPGAVLVDHERAVARRVTRLFLHLPSEAGISYSGIKMAMSYMTEKGDKYLPYVRGLFALMEQRGIRMDTDVFNILLRAPLKTQNLRKFRNTLRNMIKRGFAPNFDTWILFLRMFESVNVKYCILQAMNAKNMIGTPENIQRIANEMALYDANYAAVQGKDLATFLQEQEDRYGPDWLTRDAGNKVLHVLGEYRRYEDAFKLLDLMIERYHAIPSNHTHERLATRPDATSFATIINHARLERKVPLAVNVLRKMNTRKALRQPSLTILHLLFDLAWKKRLRATIVVIWWYASLARLTSYRMRRRVTALLSGDLGPPGHQEITAEVYHQLGGETLARELVGGPEALEQIKVFCRQTWGENYPRKRLASLAAKVLSVTFEGYGPAVELGEVLSQSILVDHRCLRARKSNQLKDLLATAKVKSLPIWERQKGREMWVHLAPPDATEPALIKHDDVWKDEWDSEGWDAKSRLFLSKEYRDKFEEDYRIWQAKNGEQSYPEQIADPAKHTKTGAIEEEANSPANTANALRPIMEKHIPIINPMVWDDEKHDVSADQRTQLQRQNEEAILNALKEAGKDIKSFRYAFDDDDDFSIEHDLSMKIEGGDQSGGPFADGAGYDLKEEIGEPEKSDSETEAENRLERIRQMIAEFKTDLQEDRPGHDSEENGRAGIEQMKE
ncbi:hypothetical protein N0V82_002830 [Gnomoniopsis sp. IMI 355080]|nr:hypothetical protein N0V82_002830 [Gnomoniopsis sp. IMI 355080]